MECWAKQLGGCCGGQSGEHYVTKALFEGSEVTMKGLPWCRDEPMTIPITGAKANILCKHHNEVLSDADNEITQYQIAIERLNRRPHLNKEGKMRKPPERVVFSGKLISRWLTKTYCNMFTVTKRTCDSRFVQHSFGVPYDPPLRFYLNMRVGMLAKFERGHVTVFDYWDNFGNLIWCAGIAGFVWVVTTLPIKDLGDKVFLGDKSVSTNDFLEKPREMTMTHMVRVARNPLTTGVLALEW